MDFYTALKKENNPDGKIFAVYMRIGRDEHYVCDFIDGDTAKNTAANELGLTLRTRLIRSRGKYAMSEGTVFNPERLLSAACIITDYKKESFIDGQYKKGYTLLTITADGCVNKYMVFDKFLLDTLTKKLDLRLVKSK